MARSSPAPLPKAEMAEAVNGVVEQLLISAPCSIELPAGTGKTELLANAGGHLSQRGLRSLVLTHTNAGVDVLRKRFRRRGVKISNFRVETIASLAFQIVRAYPTLAGLNTAELPDWTQSRKFIQGATRALSSDAIQRVFANSFDFAFVDEYQDCDIHQHAFVLSLNRAIPRTVILGDPLQAIFTFGEPLPDWEKEVLTSFHPYSVPLYPHRWAVHNRDLGQWLLDIRPELQSGQQFDITARAVSGVRFIPNCGPSTLASAVNLITNLNESVVLLDKWPNDVSNHASRLGGRFLVMEDIAGGFMSRSLKDLPEQGDPQLATWLARLSKQCMIGLAGIDQRVLTKLEAGQAVSHLARPGLEPALSALEALQKNPTYEEAAGTGAEILRCKGVRLFRREAWQDTCGALAQSAENSDPPEANLVRRREALRRVGRPEMKRVASRTLLVKGLEYDHVIIADLNKMRDPRNLYVALSRARKSVIAIGSSPAIFLKDND